MIPPLHLHKHIFHYSQQSIKITNCALQPHIKGWLTPMLTRLKHIGKIMIYEYLLWWNLCVCVNMNDVDGVDKGGS